jgi:hypothetical protein
VVAMQYDYMPWTKPVAQVAEQVLGLKNQNKNYAGFALFISGNVSPRARDELSKRGVKIYERQLPGPLR